MTEFRCEKCNCVSNGIFEIKTNEDKKAKWNSNRAKQIELQTKQISIEDKINDEVAKHNSEWFGFKGVVSPWMTSKLEKRNTLSIIHLYGSKLIKQVEFDDTVMSPWLNFLHREPMFEYIECPVCKYKNYMKC